MKFLECNPGLVFLLGALAMLLIAYIFSLRRDRLIEESRTRIRVIEAQNEHERRMAELNNEAIRLDNKQSKAVP